MNFEFGDFSDGSYSPMASTFTASGFMFDLPAFTFGDIPSPTSSSSPASSSYEPASPASDAIEVARPRSASTFVLPANPFPRRSSSTSSYSSDSAPLHASASSTICPQLLSPAPSSPASLPDTSSSFRPHPHPIHRPKAIRPTSNSERKRMEILELSKWVSAASPRSERGVMKKRGKRASTMVKNVVVRAPNDPKSSPRDVMEAMRLAEARSHGTPTLAGIFPDPQEKYRMILKGIQQSGYDVL